MSRKEIKYKIQALLHGVSEEQDLNELEQYPVKKIINALFPFICHPDENVKWRAVTFMGHYIVQLAEQDIESARIILRRFIWNLNEESGGIGWGGPEVMGVVLAQHRLLADEFTQMLVSFIREDGAFLEYELLQRGVVWGLGRMVRDRSALLKELETGKYLLPFLDSPDATVRGLTAWVLGLLKYSEAKAKLRELQLDSSTLTLYDNNELLHANVGTLCKNALQLLS